jgi:hypothetical protein
MSTTITREASITYNGYVVGGAQTQRILRDVYFSEDSYESSVVQYTFTLCGDDTLTQAQFEALCSAAESDLRIPHADLAIAGLGSKSFSHSGGSGFNAVPSVTKFEHPSDSGRARTYRVRIEFGRPGGASGTGGRRVTRTSINVDYGPQRRRTVTISGEWAGASARGTYESEISGYANGILAGLGGTYKILNEPQTSSDDANKVIRIAITYEEILDTQVGGADADIRAETFSIRRTTDQPGDTPVGNSFVQRLVHLNVSYLAYIERTDTNIRSKWSTLRTRIVNSVRNTYQMGSVVILSESPDFDYTDNKITATMTVLGIPSNRVIECHATTEHDTEEGVVLVPVWNGDKWARYQFQGPASEVRTEHIVQKVLGVFFTPQGSPHIFADQFSGRGDLVLKKKMTNASHEILGGSPYGSSAGTPISIITETRVYERAKIIKGSAETPRPDTPDPSKAVSNGAPGTNGGGGPSVSTGGGGGTGSGKPS